MNSSMPKLLKVQKLKKLREKKFHYAMVQDVLVRVAILQSSPLACGLTLRGLLFTDLLLLRDWERESERSRLRDLDWRSRGERERDRDRSTDFLARPRTDELFDRRSRDLDRDRDLERRSTERERVRAERLRERAERLRERERLLLLDPLLRRQKTM